MPVLAPLRALDEPTKRPTGEKSEYKYVARVERL
jgi:hypothetical protein